MNCELIKYVEATPDTILTLTTDEKIMVLEKVDKILEDVRKYKREIFKFPDGKE